MSSKGLSIMGEYIHSKQVQFSKSPVSCGILEVHHLPADTTGNDILFSIANTLYHKANPRPAAFVLFSDVNGKQTQSRGELLAKAINAFEGVVISPRGLYTSTRVINPKTGNTITTWLWTIPHEQLRDWYTDEYANRVNI
jgi:hypothetical protein